MPKAILALRSYPLAILMALVLFVCSFIIATSSIGTIGSGGGDDQGSGMGGTGRTGGLNGDSGFGGTGGPSPFLGSNESDTEQQNSPGEGPADSLIEPFLQQQQTETARIPEDMRPLIELQRSTPATPTFQNDTPSLDMLDDDSRELPPHARRLLDMADASANDMVEQPALEIQLQIPEATSTDDIERFRLEVAEPVVPAQTAPDVEPEPATASQSDDSLFILQQLKSEEIADNDAELDEPLPENSDFDSDRSLIPERIQRPELPPFQRMRPAVDRASIVAPRPRPMQI